MSVARLISACGGRAYIHSMNSDVYDQRTARRIMRKRLFWAKVRRVWPW
jgi:hypothetical protein